MRWTPELTILVGVLLVFSPLWVGHLHVGDPTYRYEAVEVEPTENGVEYGDGYDGRGIDSQIVCDAIPGRPCIHERYLLTDRNVSTDRSPQTLNHYRYDYVHAEDGFYEVAYEERDDRTYLRLDLIPTETLFRRIATPVNDLPDPVRTAVGTGSVTTRRTLLDANELVLSDGTYYVVQERLVRSSTEAERRGELFEDVVSVLGPAVGLVLALRGYRRFLRGY